MWNPNPLSSLFTWLPRLQMLRMVAIHTVVFSYSEGNTLEHTAALISSCEGVWLMLLFQKQGSGLSFTPHRRYPFLIRPPPARSCLFSGPHMPQAQRGEKYPNFASLFPIKGKSPPYPALEHVFLSPGTLPLSPSSLLNRSQSKT